MHDYKIRTRPERESLGAASPFNVKTESLFMDPFTEAEVDSPGSARRGNRTGFQRGCTKRDIPFIERAALFLNSRALGLTYESRVLKKCTFFSRKTVA